MVEVKKPCMDELPRAIANLSPEAWPKPSEDGSTTISPEVAIAIFQVLGYLATQYERCAKTGE
jgi:hypothetical protein